jgi:acetamidase/formamidase
LKALDRAACSVYLLDPALAPALTVAAGEHFSLATEDASSGLLTDGSQPPTLASTPYARHDPPRANPVSGPVFVESVVAGGRVRVDVHDIVLESTGVFYVREGIASLRRAVDTQAVGAPVTERLQHREGRVVTAAGRSWQARPMIGTLATAPDWEPRSTATGQGPWGGNLDCKAIAPGCSVTLSAYHDGGLLFAGDVHGCQGDGELLGVADESRAQLILSASPVASDGRPLPAPRIETPTELIALGIDKSLELAIQRAAEHLVDWLADELGWHRRDAWLAVSLHPDFRLSVHSATPVSALRFVVGASLPRVEVLGSDRS